MWPRLGIEELLQTETFHTFIFKQESNIFRKILQFPYIEEERTLRQFYYHTIYMWDLFGHFYGFTVRSKKKHDS